MGNAYSFVKGHSKRLINRYNAQYRALELLNKENLPRAPRHAIPPDREKELSGVPINEEILKKNETLDGYLKEVYVKSYDSNPEIRSTNRNVLLPELREAKVNYTFVEPVQIDKGYCTISQITEFLSDNANDPVKYSASRIARKYHLDRDKVDQILEYFTVFVLSGDPHPFSHTLTEEGSREVLEKKYPGFLPSRDDQKLIEPPKTDKDQKKIDSS